MSTINLNALIKKLNSACQRSLEASAGTCVSRTHYNIEIEHWLLQLLEDADNDIGCIIKHYGIDKYQLIQDLEKSLRQVKTGNAQAPALSYRIVELCKAALMVATLEFNNNHIRSGYLLYALLHVEDLQRLLSTITSCFQALSADSLRHQLAEIIISSNECTESDNLAPVVNNNSKTPALDQYTINLTELAREGKIDEVIGREAEIHQMIDILMRRRQNNPILTGEPGVGKTAVVEGLALLIARGEVPNILNNAAIHTLDLGLLQAGAGVKGEFENRLKSVIHEVNACTHPVILFIDEAHTLVGAGAQAGQGDAANLLKPALARGELKTIAATTWSEYKKYFEKDAALVRRFQVVKIEEPSEKVAINMLRGLVKRLEMHHQVRILDEAILAAVQLSHRYLPERQLPDKAISVLDTACSQLALRSSTKPLVVESVEREIMHIDEEILLLEREVLSGAEHDARLKYLKSQHATLINKKNTLVAKVTAEKEIICRIQTLRKKLESDQNVYQDEIKQELKALKEQLTQTQAEIPIVHDSLNAQCIAEVISGWTGIPLGRMIKNEINTILNLSELLSARILGQTHALETITQNIYTSRAKLSDPRKPLGVFLFVGPSGVGKTETALALADQLYGGTQNMTTINLSEFKEEHKVSMLLGSPPGYVGYGEGGVLTEAVRRAPYSLILLDEIDKAHVGVQDIFYQVFDKGMLKDGQGRDIDFKNTILILTSNVGSELITKYCSDAEKKPDMNELVKLLQPELQRYFKPAFLGRVTIVPYLAFQPQTMKKIIKLQLMRIKQRICEQYKAKLNYDEKLISLLLEKCNFAATGARNVEHVLTHGILTELSAQFLKSIASNKKLRSIKITVNENDALVYQYR